MLRSREAAHRGDHPIARVVAVAEMAEALGTSEMTLRRDLRVRPTRAC